MMSTKLVGPIIINNEMAEALVAAIAYDNPDAEMYIDGYGGYLRIHTEQSCRVTRKSLEAVLGYSFELSQIEPALVAFAGRIRVSDDEIVWYLEN